MPREVEARDCVFSLQYQCALCCNTNMGTALKYWFRRYCVCCVLHWISCCEIILRCTVYFLALDARSVLVCIEYNFIALHCIAMYYLALNAKFVRLALLLCIALLYCIT